MKKTLKGITFGIAAIMASFLPCISTHAESKTATVTASIAESLSLTLSAGSMDFNLETNDLYIDFINVIGRTNSANGYTISFNANNDYNDLKHSNALIEDKIASIEGPRTESEFPNKSWGYSVDESNYTFKKIPLAPKNIFATSEQGETTHKFTTGVKGGADLVAGDYENELLFTIIANPLVNNTDDDDDDAPLVYDEKAKAILGTNGNLNFVYDDNTYAIGDTYNDNTGETDIADIFRVPLNSHNWDTKPDWANNPDIVSVNFDESFRNFHPTKTAYWFFEDQHMTTVTNAQNFNASTVTNMSGMFKYVGENAESDINIDLTSWDVSNVKKMTEMFEYIGYNTTKNIDINLQGWDTENLVDLSYFMDNSARNAESITVNMNDWDVRKVQTTYNALYFIGSSAKNIDISLNNWNAEKLTNMSNMVRSIGYNQYEHTDSTLKLGMKNFRAPIVESVGHAFDCVGYRSYGNIGGTANIDFSNMSLPNITSAYRMFSEVGKYNKNVALNLSSLKVPKATNFSEMFDNAMYGSDNLKIDVSNWQMGSAENMSNMFSYVGYGSKSEIGKENPDLYDWEIKGLETFDMDKVTNVSRMFMGAAEYNFDRKISLDLSSWNTEKLENASTMFMYFAQNNTGDVTVKLNDWNVEKMTDISSMFSSAMQYAESADIDLSGWNTENITNMDSAFAYAGEHAGSLSINGLNDWDVSSASRVNIFQGTGKDCGFVAPF